MSKQRQFLYPCTDDAQLCLGLGEYKATERVFFAVLPEPAAAARIAALRSELIASAGVQPTAAARMRPYVMLHPLGDYAGLPPSLLARAGSAAARLQSSAFEARFDRILSSAAGHAGRICVLRGDEGVRGLMQLQRTLARRLAEAGIRSEARCIAQIQLFDCSGQLTPRRVEPIAWQVSDIMLVRRTLGVAGTDQIEARWPLCLH